MKLHKKDLYRTVCRVACFVFLTCANAAAADYTNSESAPITGAETCKTITGETEASVIEFEGQCSVTHECPQELTAYTVSYYQPGRKKSSWTSDAYPISSVLCGEEESVDLEYDSLGVTNTNLQKIGVNGTWELCVTASSNDYSGSMEGWTHRLTVDGGAAATTSVPADNATTTTTILVEATTTVPAATTTVPAATTTVPADNATTTTILDSPSTTTSAAGSEPTTSIAGGSDTTSISGSESTTTSSVAGDLDTVAWYADPDNGTFMSDNASPWIDATTHGEGLYEYAEWLGEDCIHIRSAAAAACDNESSNPECSRVKLRSNTEGGFGFGTYTCRVWTPWWQLFARKQLLPAGYKRAIGFSVTGVHPDYGEELQSIGFEIGYGTRLIRLGVLGEWLRIFPFKKYQLVTYVTVRHPRADGSEEPKESYTVLPISPWRWHDLDITVKRLGENTVLVEWAIDGIQVYAEDVNWSDVAFQIQCSVENLDKMGDVDPAKENGAYFSLIKYVPKN
ncbi:hypothetical protein ACFL43_06095 [Thermodesulfobacteriota bacterium]